MGTTVANSRRRIACLAGVVSLTVSGLGLGPWASLAQAAVVDATGTDVLEEVVVTATRREDTIGRVPLSITAFKQSSLTTQGVENISDLRLITPGLGLTFGNLNPGSASGKGIIRVRVVYRKGKASERYHGWQVVSELGIFIPAKADGAGT